MREILFKKPNYKELKAEGLLGVDMHFHTQYSLDAVSKLDNVLRKAKKLGIGIAVTDHNAIRGAVLANKNKLGVFVVPGVEVTCAKGTHILCYFYSVDELKEFYTKKLSPLMERNPFFVNADPQHFIESTIDEYNCVIGAPHPFAPGAIGLQKIKIPPKVEKNIKLIEALNGYEFHKSNLKSIDWATVTNKGVTGGSDGHTTRELGRVLTCAYEQDLESFYKSLQRRKSFVVGREDNLLLRALYLLSKETTYINKSKHQHMARVLIKSQLGSELKYFKEKFKRTRFYHRFKQNHAGSLEQ
ncbi:PHP domain-containing protein [Candidatus Woesearchaeota archaeon]|nr:PHP domain-containing protein [Candidatus Woesearchaeota archaeon]